MRPLIDEARYMQVALSEAEKALHEGEVPVGACVVMNGDVISSAHNRMEAESDPTAHAEIVAIRAAAKSLGSWRLTGCTLYVSLEPCAMCAGALVHARIDRIVYAAADAKAGACGSILDIPRDFRLNHFVEVKGGIMEDEASSILRGFFSIKR